MNRRGFEFLEGFEKRMQIVAAVDSIVNRGNRRMDIERLFDATESVTGPLDTPDSGIIFAIPVTHVRGLGQLADTRMKPR